MKERRQLMKQPEKLVKTFEGYCPVFKVIRTIQVLYNLIKVDNESPMYEAFSFECDDLENCTVDDCPIGAEIPDLFEA